MRLESDERARNAGSGMIGSDIALVDSTAASVALEVATSVGSFLDAYDDWNASGKRWFVGHDTNDVLSIGRFDRPPWAKIAWSLNCCGIWGRRCSKTVVGCKALISSCCGGGIDDQSGALGCAFDVDELRRCNQY